MIAFFGAGVPIALFRDSVIGVALQLQSDFSAIGWKAALRLLRVHQGNPAAAKKAIAAWIEDPEAIAL